MNYYVIVIWNHNDKTRGNPLFYAEDSTSGGYPWFSTDMRNAAVFIDLQRAVTTAQMWFGQPQKESEKFPPSAVQSALRLDFQNQSGSGDVEIVPLVLDRASQPVLSIKIEGIIRPEGVINGEFSQARAGV